MNRGFEQEDRIRLHSEHKTYSEDEAICSYYENRRLENERL